MVKVPKVSVAPLPVRTRRAYFDCRFGQLHVRTAFPTTGGFDEQVTLFCLHPIDVSSRAFIRFLPELADVRSVYAPDLPGYGESDSSPTLGKVEAAAAVSDLADDLRLREIDLLGVQYGAAVALAVATARPDLVKRLVLVDLPFPEQAPVLKQRRLLMPLADYGGDAGGLVSKSAADRIRSFLRGRP